MLLAFLKLNPTHQTYFHISGNTFTVIFIKYDSSNTANPTVDKTLSYIAVDSVLRPTGEASKLCPILALLKGKRSVF